MSETRLNLYPIGTAVTVGDGIEGVITSISVYGHNMSIAYKVEWWNDRILNSADFHPAQITTTDEKKTLTIGFLNGRN